MAARSSKGRKAAQKSTKQARGGRTAGRGGGKSSGRFAANGLADTVNQVWLAGMGALARVQKEGPRAFESMIVEGASLLDKSRGQAEATLRDAIATVQATVEGRVKDTRSQAADTWGALEHVFQGRVQQVLKQVGVPTAKEISALTKRIDELNANVHSLAKAKRSAPKKAVRRKASAKAAPTGESAA